MQYTVITMSASRLGDPVEQEDVDRYNALVADELVKAGLDDQYSVSVSLTGNHVDALPIRWDEELKAALESAWERFCNGEDVATE